MELENNSQRQITHQLAMRLAHLERKETKKQIHKHRQEKDALEEKKSRLQLTDDSKKVSSTKL